MRLKNTFLFVALLSALTELCAQDFDADSVHYTPIPVGAQKKYHGIKAFQDSIENDKQIEYYFNVQVGPLLGCNNCSEGKEITFSSATTHGITIGKKFRTGLGIGLDSYYQWQTMPIFGSATWDVFGTKNTHAIFIQFNYGWSKSWRNESHQEYGFKDTDGGRMVNTQIGYRLKYHDLRIALAAGLKYQRVYVNYEYPTYRYTNEGVMIQGTSNTTTIQQSMNRFMITLTVGWK